MGSRLVSLQGSLISFRNFWISATFGSFRRGFGSFVEKSRFWGELVLFAA
jgi:hypothetical protein